MRALGLAGNYSAAGAFLNASVYAATLGAYGQVRARGAACVWWGGGEDTATTA